MKNYFIIGCLLATSISFAQGRPDSASEINAQATITRGAIDDLIARVNEGRSEMPFKASDYHAQIGEFQGRLQKNLLAFEDALTKDIFPKAAFWMDQYNSVYESEEFTPDQKAVLLKQRLASLKNQFKELSQRYQKAIASVYGFVPYWNLRAELSSSYSPTMCSFAKPKTRLHEFDLTYWAGNKKINQLDFKVIKEQDETLNVVLDKTSLGRFGATEVFVGQWFNRCTHLDISRFYMYATEELNITKRLYRSVYPTIKGSCRSSICVGLRSGDLVSVLSQAKSKIDRSISLKLASGELVTLDGLNAELSIINHLLATTQYPEELPFDI